MYMFFLIFFIFISFSLVFLILLQPGKGFNNTTNVHMNNNIKFFNNIGTNNLITNVIRILSFLFLLISMILCNINSRKIDKDFFWKDNIKNTIIEKSLKNEKILHSDIPN